ncbi:transmembrane channel-like protein 7 [Trichogramma pretiosum]|uniref:transmembrane channel-like protein 7 n=1 Tax=Trichogramma pretiosum TaxID=7493 RepID=UPI0006C959B9|nr:transmembrane channel-like protein 7 [Trichogramma pretiosum]
MFSTHTTEEIIELEKVTVQGRETYRSHTTVEFRSNTGPYENETFAGENSNHGEESENNEAGASAPFNTIRNSYQYNTIRSRKSTPAEIEKQANVVVSCLQKSHSINNDSLISEQQILQIIKALPQNISLKRLVKSKLIKSMSEKSKPIGTLKKWKYQASMAFIKLNLAIRDMMSTFELWYGSIKMINGYFGNGIGTYFKFLRWLFILNIFNFTIILLFVIIPQSLLKMHANQRFEVEDLLFGTGVLENSVMFYGFYTNSSLTIYSEKTYSMPSAYFLAFSFTNLFIFLLLFFKVARSYKETFIETSGGAYNRFAKKIFYGWDWSISSKEMAELRSASIRRELAEMLWEAKHPKTSETYQTTAKSSTRPWPLSLASKICTFLVRGMMTSLMAALVCGSAGLLWFSMEENWMSDLTVPVIITAMVNLMPPLISWSVKFENYKRKRSIYWMKMIRGYVILGVALGTVPTFWLERSSGCWQNRLAQQIYHLMLLDLVLTLPLGLLIRYAKKRWLLGSGGFNDVHESLILIYLQCLCWLGQYFSPPLGLLLFLRLLLTFYLKRFELFRYCKPPNHYWRAAEAQTTLLALIFIGNSIILGMLFYVLAYVDTSTCGPFAGTTYTGEFIIERLLLIPRDSVIWNVISEMTSPVVSTAVLISMCLAVYYMRAKAEASKLMISVEREMLMWQARDKKFLLAWSRSPLLGNEMRNRRYNLETESTCRSHDRSGELDQSNPSNHSFSSQYDTA